MSKTIKIFIVIIILLGLGALGYYFFSNKTVTNPDGTTDSLYQTFNPFGSSTDVNNGNQTEGETTGNTETELNSANSNLKQITTFAIAGATFFEDQREIPEPEKEVTVLDTFKTTEKVVTTKKVTPLKVEKKYETVPTLRYVERATGHIYQIYLDKNSISKVSNTTIPSIYEALFDNKASSVIYRYLSGDKTITSFKATLGGASGEFLPEDIINIDTSNDKTKLFYLVKTQNGVTGFIKSFTEAKNTQVFTSSFSEWLSQFISDKKIYLTTKPSWSISGSLYSLNTATGSISKLFGGIAGLTTLANNDGSTVLFGASESSGPKLGSFNVTDRTSSLINLYGLPEKCVWSSDNINIYCGIPKTIIGTEYPDSWYQGLVSFDDYFVKINTKTGGTSTIENGNDASPVDATNLFLNKDEDTLFFTNKKDSTLWSLKI